MNGFSVYSALHKCQLGQKMRAQVNTIYNIPNWIIVL